MKKLLLGIATIIGTVIGAGVLGLPYAISKSGFIPGIILLAFISFSMTLLLLYLGEVVLRCRRVYQLPGLARKYLGKRSYQLTLLMFALSIYGALISYIVGVSSSLSILIGGEKYIYMILFTALISVPVIKGVHLMDKIQLVFTSLLIALIIIISAVILPEVRVENLLTINTANIFYPFGVIFFALTGYSVMPELEMILTRKKSLFKPAVLIAMTASTLIYLFFTFSFVGVYGNSISEVATESLKGLLGIIGSLIAIFGMTTSFMGLGVALSDVFKKDLRLNKWIAWALTCLLPLGIALSFNISFIEPLLISGAYTGTFTGFIIIALWAKARKEKGEKPSYTAPFGMWGAVIVSAVLVVGLVMTTINLIF